ncbi:MAG: prephenate dehydrogenase/arogenate dehydrogenase family protein, partial [Candidatus Aenigmarchaeota archaeon]|nr:prephenate dehydrogenase/arogenate dehydrogenase family protein [Candidatus Aenigmarchaeota archaeon]
MKKPVIGIIGGTHGLGNWFKAFFENNKYSVLISGRKTKLTNIELTKKSDVVIVSVPIRETSQVIKEILPFLKDDSLLMDFTSVKTEPLNEMKKAKKTIGVVGLHPLFGPLVTNISNQYIAVCMKRENKLWKEMKKLLEKEGANLVNMTANEHDKQMAIMQALLHFVNLSYVKTLCEKKITPEGNFSTPVFQLQTM